MMFQQQMRFGFECVPYQIRLLGGDGETMLIHQTLCVDDDEAIDALFALKDISYERFEIICDGEVISQGARCK
jgi:hypothetical protein